MHRLIACLILAALLLPHAPTFASDQIPAEPVEIGNTPQYLFDNYIVENHWGLKHPDQSVERVFHAPKKHEANPVVEAGAGYVNVVYDEQAELFRMWVQSVNPEWERATKAVPKTGIAYLESEDGLNWRRPDLGLHEWSGVNENNICLVGPHGWMAAGMDIIHLPEQQRRGYRFIGLYLTNDGFHLIGSNDGKHWDRDNDLTITTGDSIHSDTYNNMVYDPKRDRYLLYCRPKHIFRHKRGPMLETGASRRVAVVTNDELWTKWDIKPRTIMVPDKLDAQNDFRFFYGMPVKYHAGLFWGSVWPFRMNNAIHTEFAYSRNGIDFQRLPTRPKLIKRGPEGSWDDGMVFGGPGWVEVGDEWWFFYTGWDGPHNTRQRTAGVGIARIKRGRLIGMRGPKDGGVICTRTLRWPGGDLVLNGNADGGEISVRVSDAGRQPIEGFDYRNAWAMRDDDVSHRFRWREGAMDDLTGRVIRLEFYLKDAELFSFRAAPRSEDAANGGAPSDIEPTNDGRTVFHAPFDAGDGHPEDASPTGVNVTLADGDNSERFPEWIADGHKGGALRFDGEDDYVVAAHHPATRPANGALELWFRPDELLNRRTLHRTSRYLLNIHRDSAHRVYLSFNDNNGALTLTSKKKGGLTVDVRSDITEWEAGRWYHVRVTFGDGGMRMYIDGELQQDQDASTRGLDHLDRGGMYIGDILPFLDNRAFTFPGDIDEVRVISRDTD